MKIEIMFEKSINFILSLDIEKMHAEQLDKLSDIILKIESADDDDIDEFKRAKKTDATVRMFSRSYMRKNRISLKGNRKKIARTAEKKKHERQKDRMSAAGKTPSGRNKILYNTMGHIN